MLASLTVLLGWVVLGNPEASGADSNAETSSYEATASAEGVRFSVSAPGFAVVETFIDGGGPVAASMIDGLGNSRAFASLPYPGDLAISGPGLLAGLTGLPSPPAYPFYVDSSYPTKEEAKFAQPGYELLARSAEASSEAAASTGGGSEQGGIGLTTTSAVSSRDAGTGTVTAEATGTSDFVALGPLRVGHVVAMAKVTRPPGAEPSRESSFSIGAVTVNDQAVGVSEKGLTLAGQTTPLPADNPLFKALEQAKISISTLAAIQDPDGVVSPGLVIEQQQQIPSGPNMVFRYVFGRMAAHATVSGSPTSVGSELPLETGPAGGPVENGGTASEPTSPSSGESFAGAPADDRSALPTSGKGSAPGVGEGSPVGGGDYGNGSSDAGQEGVASPPVGAPAPAAPIVAASGPSAKSVYLIVALGAIVALAGGLLIRILGVRLVWTS